MDALIEQLPAATGVITPELETVHLAASDVEYVTAPSEADGVAVTVPVAPPIASVKLGVGEPKESVRAVKAADVVQFTELEDVYVLPDFLYLTL